MIEKKDRPEFIDNDDLVKRIAEKLEISEESADEHLKFLVDWITEITKDPEVFSTYIPKMGALYFNEPETAKLVRELQEIEQRVPELSKTRRELLETQKEKLDKLDKMLEETPMHTLHKRKPRFFRKWHRYPLDKIKQLQKFQNEKNIG